MAVGLLLGAVLVGGVVVCCGVGAGGWLRGCMDAVGLPTVGIAAGFSVVGSPQLAMLYSCSVRVVCGKAVEVCGLVV